MSDAISIEESFVLFHNSEEAKNLKHGKGWPKDKVWQYFDYNITKYFDHYDVKCKFYKYY